MPTPLYDNPPKMQIRFSNIKKLGWIFYVSYASQDKNHLRAWFWFHLTKPISVTSARGLLEITDL